MTRPITDITIEKILRGKELARVRLVYGDYIKYNLVDDENGRLVAEVYACCPATCWAIAEGVAVSDDEWLYQMIAGEGDDTIAELFGFDLDELVGFISAVDRVTYTYTPSPDRAEAYQRGYTHGQAIRHAFWGEEA